MKDEPDDVFNYEIDDFSDVKLLNNKYQSFDKEIDLYIETLDKYVDNTNLIDIDYKKINRIIKSIVIYTKLTYLAKNADEYENYANKIIKLSYKINDSKIKELKQINKELNHIINCDCKDKSK